MKNRPLFIILILFVSSISFADNMLLLRRVPIIRAISAPVDPILNHANLTHYYKFDEGSGTTANDSKGTTHLQLTGASAWLSSGLYLSGTGKAESGAGVTHTNNTLFWDIEFTSETATSGYFFVLSSNPDNNQFTPRMILAPEKDHFHFTDWIGNYTPINTRIRIVWLSNATGNRTDVYYDGLWVGGGTGNWEILIYLIIS